MSKAKSTDKATYLPMHLEGEFLLINPVFFPHNINNEYHSHPLKIFNRPLTRRTGLDTWNSADGFSKLGHSSAKGVRRERTSNLGRIRPPVVFKGPKGCLAAQSLFAKLSRQTEIRAELTT